VGRETAIMILFLIILACIIGPYVFIAAILTIYAYLTAKNMDDDIDI
jgi:hypothetical protein